MRFVLLSYRLNSLPLGVDANVDIAEDGSVILRWC